MPTTQAFVAGPLNSTSVDSDAVDRHAEEPSAMHNKVFQSMEREPERLRFYPVRTLRIACRHFKIKISGSKDDLVVRLAAHLITKQKLKRCPKSSTHSSSRVEKGENNAAAPHAAQQQTQRQSQPAEADRKTQWEELRKQFVKIHHNRLKDMQPCPKPKVPKALKPLASVKSQPMRTATKAKEHELRPLKAQVAMATEVKPVTVAQTVVPVPPLQPRLFFQTPLLQYGSVMYQYVKQGAVPPPLGFPFLPMLHPAYQQPQHLAAFPPNGCV